MARRVGIPGRADGRTLSSGGVARSGSTTDSHLAVWDGSNADSIKDGGVADIFGFGALTQPLALSGNWTADNISTYFVPTESNGVIHFECSLQSGDNIRGYHRALPGTPKVTAAFLLLGYSNAYDVTGLYISDGTKFKLFGIEGSGGPHSHNFNNTTTWSGENNPGTVLPFRGPLLWMQYEESGGTRYFRLSPNGVYWYVAFTETNTTFLTATVVGFGSYVAVAGANSSPGAIGTLVHWKEG